MKTEVEEGQNQVVVSVVEINDNGGGAEPDRCFRA
jgi:hypothetical protein